MAMNPNYKPSGNYGGREYTAVPEPDNLPQPKQQAKASKLPMEQKAVAGAKPLKGANLKAAKYATDPSSLMGTRIAPATLQGKPGTTANSPQVGQPTGPLRGPAKQ